MTTTLLKKRADAPARGPRTMPPGFFERDGRVWYAEPKSKEEIEVCRPIEAHDAVRNGLGTGWQTRFTFRNLDGQDRIVAISDGDLSTEPRRVAAVLGVNGFGIVHAPILLVRLLGFKASRLPDDRRGLLVDRPGFHGDAFVTPGGETLLPIGAADQVLVPAETAPAQKAGDLAGQKAAIAAAIRTALDHFALAPLMGVAGAVVDFAQIDTTPILTLAGASSTGKSTALALAASMSGPPSGAGSRFGTLSTTPNAIEGRLSAASGTFFAGDETAHFPREKLEELIFVISSGEGKNRMTVDALMRLVRYWRTFTALSSETPLIELMRTADGRQTRAGATVRAASIDTSGARTLGAAELASVRQFEVHYGHVLPLVAQQLLDSTLTDPNARASLRAELADRAVALAGHDAPALMKRSASVFAILGVAGRLLREVEATPGDFDADALVRAVWERFRSSADAPVDPVERAVRHLTEALYRERGSRLANVGDVEGPRLRAPVGYFEPMPGGKAILFYIPTSQLAELAGGNVSVSTLAAALDRAGLLDRPEAKRRTWGKVPGVGAIQHYRVRLPDAGQEAEQPSALNTILPDGPPTARIASAAPATWAH